MASVGVKCNIEKTNYWWSERKAIFFDRDLISLSIEF